MRILGHIVRFIISAIVLLVVGWIVPAFEIGGFWSALLMAIVIAVAGWLIESAFGRRVTPFGRGIVGFLISALVIWLSQFVVPNVSITLFGAIIAALVIGIIDLFVPTPFQNRGRAR